MAISVRPIPPLLAGALSLAGFVSAVGAAASATVPAPSIPLCPGLTIVTAVSQQGGDYESIKTIETVGAEIRMKYSAELKNNDMFGAGPPIKQLNLHRTMLGADLDAATDYQQIFLDNSAETIPLTTSIGASAGVLGALKSKGQTDFGISIAYDGLELGADRSKTPNYYSYLERGTIKRVDGPPTTLSVIVNDQSVDLPVIRAQGELVGDKVEFLFLDDLKNPLTIAFRIGIDAIKPLDPAWIELCKSISKTGQAPGGLPGGTRCDRPNGGDRDVLRVVKIAYRCPVASPVRGSAPGAAGIGAASGALAAGAASEVEQALAARHPAEIYSIYFSFNSDSIRDESEPTLKELADILRRHPDWKLAVNGHTDGIGSDQFNLDLSKRRAAAVKSALVARYGIDTDRLTFTGLGKSQPKDTNDTLEGRAKNRRVELMRL